MSSILQIYLLRTCMYVCRTPPPRHRRSRGEGEELEERAKTWNFIEHWDEQ